MKRLCLVLILILCLNLFSGCSFDPRSSPENAAEAYFEAKYIEFDADAYFDICFCHQGSFIEKFCEDDSDLRYIVQYNNKIRGDIRIEFDERAEECEDDEITYYIESVDLEKNYKSGSEKFDSIVGSLKHTIKNYLGDYLGTLDLSDFDDMVEECALVDVELIKYEDGDEESLDFDVYLAKINGQWYVDSVREV